jgi:hypothetical protein
MLTKLKKWLRKRPKGEWVEKRPGQPPIHHIIVKVEDQIMRMPRIEFK